MYIELGLPRSHNEATGHMGFSKQKTNQQNFWRDSTSSIQSGFRLWPTVSPLFQGIYEINTIGRIGIWIGRLSSYTRGRRGCIKIVNIPMGREGRGGEGEGGEGEGGKRGRRGGGGRGRGEGGGGRGEGRGKERGMEERERGGRRGEGEGGKKRIGERRPIQFLEMLARQRLVEAG